MDKERQFLLPGEQMVDVILAQPGGIGEAVLREIAKPACGKEEKRNGRLRHPRDFGNWIHGTCCGIVFVSGFRRSMRLRLVTESDIPKNALYLEEAAGNQLGYKYRILPRGGYVLSVGRDLTAKQIRQFATELVALFIIHGQNWHDRAGCEFRDPLGAKRKEKIIPPNQPKPLRRRARTGRELEHYLF